ncbi:MAG TPA: 4-(cytidine 5'-diphospho)-2-C-methyl-D-erythritol kinase [Chitinophagaceae bacterium]|nr:4-(cytidine 5'-diphospho)-2-C-methyl-D-erythritol kinase [Chitinophagaceae bacterium]
MLVFPNCKINLGLNIISRRSDGYHNIETVFLPVPLEDVLEILPSYTNTGEVNFTYSGLEITGEPSDNLCIKAYQLLKKDFPHLPAVKGHLHKAIPMGAGLGGGSADGAFMLILLNNKFRLGISIEDLTHYALQLGSDCPFFIINKPCFAESRGEAIQPVDLSLSGYTLLLVNPAIHISTGWAFSAIVSASPAKSIKATIKQPVDSWKNELINDFEAPVLSNWPELKLLKQQLYDMGAIYAGMSGSGSTFFGIFAPGVKVPQASLPANYFVKQFVLA